MSLPNLGIKTDTNSDIDSASHRLVTPSVNTNTNNIHVANPDGSQNASNVLYQRNDGVKPNTPSMNYQQLTSGESGHVGGYRYQQQQQPPQQMQPIQLQQRPQQQQASTTAIAITIRNPNNYGSCNSSSSSSGRYLTNNGHSTRHIRCPRILETTPEMRLVFPVAIILQG